MRERLVGRKSIRVEGRRPRPLRSKAVQRQCLPWLLNVTNARMARRMVTALVLGKARFIRLLRFNRRDMILIRSPYTTYRESVAAAIGLLFGILKTAGCDHARKVSSIEESGTWMIDNITLGGV